MTTSTISAGHTSTAFLFLIASLYRDGLTATEIHRVLLHRLARWRESRDPRHAIPGFTDPPADGPAGCPAGFSVRSILALRPSGQVYHSQSRPRPTRVSRKPCLTCRDRGVTEQRNEHGVRYVGPCRDCASDNQ